MNKNLSRIPYGERDNRLVNIYDLKTEERGLACNCVCPACKDRLEARLGTGKRIPYFAHYSRNCSFGYQTSIHKMAKALFSKHKNVLLPSVILETDYFYYTIKKEEEFRISEIKLESVLGDIIPDIEVVDAAGNRLLIEIYVTHKVDEEKKEKIRKADISTIEVDLSDIDYDLDSENLEAILFSELGRWKWIYNRGEEYIRQLFDKKTIRFHVEDVVVLSCPKPDIPKMHNRYYPKVCWGQVNCLYCQYCQYCMRFHQGIYEESYVICVYNLIGENTERLKQFKKKPDVLERFIIGKPTQKNEGNEGT